MIYSRFVIAILIFTMHIIAMPPAGPIIESEESKNHTTNPCLYDSNGLKEKVLEKHFTALMAQHPHLPEQYHSHLSAYVAMAHDEYQNLTHALTANFKLPALPIGSGKTSQPPTFLVLRRFLAKSNAAILLGLIRTPYPLHKHKISMIDPESPDKLLEPKCYDILEYLQRNPPTNPALEKTFHLLLTDLTTLSKKFERTIQNYRREKLNAYAEKQKAAVLRITGATTYPLDHGMFPPLTPVEKTPLPRRPHKFTYEPPKQAPKPPRQSLTESPKKKAQSWLSMMIYPQKIWNLLEIYASISQTIHG